MNIQKFTEAKARPGMIDVIEKEDGIELYLFFKSTDSNDISAKHVARVEMSWEEVKNLIVELWSKIKLFILTL